MKIVLNVVFFGIFLTFISAKQIQFFRKDYTYNETFDAFYKLHWNYPVFTWDDAFLACDNEGATLFYPKDEEESHFIRNLTMEVAISHNVTEIFLGLHDKYGLGEFVTVDGHLTESSLSVTEPKGYIRFDSGYCVLMNILNGSYQVGPCTRKDLQYGLNFVCKKNNSVMCPTIDEGYKLAKSLKKCYKINRRPKVWNEAYQTCYMEGGILTVIHDENEASWLQEYLRSSGANEASDRYHVGIHSVTPGGELYTIKGQKLDTVYQKNINDELNNDCGAIRIYNSDIYTVTTDCNRKLPFICEINNI